MNKTDAQAILRSAGITRDLTAEQVDRFNWYYSLLIQENKKYNLTAITEEREVWLKHFADSLTGEPWIPHGAKLLDAGSGAGFPAIPLLIVRPDIEAVLIDSVNKKVNFLRQAIAELRVSATAIHTRMEDYRDGLARFDIVTSRAVAALPTLLEYTLPFAKVGGLVLAYKTSTAETATAQTALKLLHGALTPHDVGYLGYARVIFAVKKTAPTPPLYPRPGNKPRTQPL